MANEKFFRMLGLAARMRGIAFGEGAVKDSIKSGKAKLVIVASDASENTKKKFRNSCEFYAAKIIETSDRFTLGRYTGREFAVVMAVTDSSIAEEMKRCTESENEYVNGKE